MKRTPCTRSNSVSGIAAPVLAALLVVAAASLVSAGDHARRGCNGAQELPEMLAPWQLPPCRGFRSAADVGYAGNGGGGPCLECWSPFYRLW